MNSVCGSPLVQAIRKDHFKCAEFLVQSGVDVNEKGNYWDAALIQGVRSRNVECVRLLLSSGATVNIQSCGGHTALIEAVRNEDYECVDLLLRYGADVNSKGKLWDIPLIQAIKNFDDRCTKMLLNAGADVNIKGKDSYALNVALSIGNCEGVVALIRAGADVNLKDQSGNIAIIQAVTNSDAHDCTKLLTETGAAVNMKENNGTTVHGTLFNRYYKCINLLITAGADVNVAGSDGDAVLIHAVRQCGCECVNRLIQAGVDVNKTDKDGVAVLFMALWKDTSTMLKLLLKSGADVNIRKKDNNATPLIHAAIYCKIEFIGLLLLAGAHVNIYERIDFRNALMCHITSSRVVDKEITMLLLAAGEKPNFAWTSSKKGRNILDEIKEIEAEMSLKNISRKAIRNHLQDLNSRSNLFQRVPKVNYPLYLRKYLLYGFELTEESMDW